MDKSSGFKYIVKENNDDIGYITNGYKFIQNKKYDCLVLPYPLFDGCGEKDVIEFLKTRVISENSDMVSLVLEKIGLENYDVESIIEKTRGRSVNDSIWLAVSKNDRMINFLDDINTCIPTMDNFEP